MIRTVKTYVKGTFDAPTARDWGGQKPIYKHFGPDDTLYYKKEGKFYCVVDDKSARGYVIRNEDGKETFLPHDYADTISFQEARRLCRAEGVNFPSPSDKRFGKRVPPPLFIIKSPHRNQPAWNRSAILRHIDECKKRRNLVS